MRRNENRFARHLPIISCTTIFLLVLAGCTSDAQQKAQGPPPPPLVEVMQVSTSDEPQDLEKQWNSLVEDPTCKAGLPVPKLEVLRSPYRAVIHPTVDYIHSLERKHPNREIAVVIPQLVEKHWYEYFLHRQRSQLLAALLLLEDEPRISIVNVPWHVKA